MVHIPAILPLFSLSHDNSSLAARARLWYNKRAQRGLGLGRLGSFAFSALGVGAPGAVCLQKLIFLDKFSENYIFTFSDRLHIIKVR